MSHEPYPTASREEDKYFHRKEVERRMERARKREARRDDEERKHLRELHHDHCPECGAGLERLTVQEGEVRQCPVCRGVWMDEELFGHLTHPEQEKVGYLTRIFRQLILEWTLGDLPDETAPGKGR